MGRNGKNAPVFDQMVWFINLNVHKKVTSEQILLGKKPSRKSETAYLYKFIKLGYVTQLTGKVLDADATYFIEKGFEPGYTSVKMKEEMRQFNESKNENN